MEGKLECKYPRETGTVECGVLRLALRGKNRELCRTQAAVGRVVGQLV